MLEAHYNNEKKESGKQNEVRIGESASLYNVRTRGRNLEPKKEGWFSDSVRNKGERVQQSEHLQM